PPRGARLLPLPDAGPDAGHRVRFQYTLATAGLRTQVVEGCYSCAIMGTCVRWLRSRSLLAVRSPHCSHRSTRTSRSLATRILTVSRLTSCANVPSGSRHSLAPARPSALAIWLRSTAARRPLPPPILTTLPAPGSAGRSTSPTTPPTPSSAPL